MNQTETLYELFVAAAFKVNSPQTTDSSQLVKESSFMKLHENQKFPEMK